MTTRLALGAILLLALVLRLRGIDFGLPSLHDPDEPIFMLLGFHLLKDATLNPHWFGHPGTTTIYAIALVELGTYLTGLMSGRFASATDFANAIYADPGIVMVPVRLFIAACGLWCVYLTWAIGRQLDDWRVGLIAALFLAVNPLHVQYSQIVRTDIQATMFMLLSILWSIRYAQSGRMRHLVGASLCAGLACATKWPAALVIVSPLLASLLHCRAHAGANWPRAWLGGIAVAGVASLAALLLVSPYLLLDYATVLHDLTAEARPQHLGSTGAGLIANMTWYLGGPLRDSIGWTGLALTGLGAILVSARRVGAATVTSIALVFLVSISAQSLIWPRWILPLLPLVSLFMAAGIVAVAGSLSGRVRSLRPVWVTGAIVALIALPMIRATDLDARERANDTRSQASAWARHNIPGGSSIAIEYLGIDLLGHGWTVLYPAGAAGCVDAQAAVSGKVQFNSGDKMRGQAAILNLATIDEGHRASCEADYAFLIYYDRYRAERARFPREVANYDRIMHAGTLVRSFLPARGVAGGPIVRVVRMKRGAAVSQTARTDALRPG